MFERGKLNTARGITAQQHDRLTFGEAGRRRQTLSASWIAWLKSFMSVCSSARCASKLAVEEATEKKSKKKKKGK